MPGSENGTKGQSPLYVGVDVGTSSVRAALVTDAGDVIRSVSYQLTVFEPEADYYEQSSDGVWEACCQSVKMVMEGIPKTRVHGIGFDGTCSLVVLDSNCKPLTVSPSGFNKWNIVMWMDHRATEQTTRINKGGHDVLKFVGGTMSPEMQMPKLLWLKEHMKDKCWDKAGHFFDLPDFLTWKASGSFSRSLCSLVCKWTYQCERGGCKGWSDDFFTSIGLEDLIKQNYSKIGNEVKAPGEPCGSGLSTTAAEELGLAPNTPVATSIIDAHSGGLGTLGCKLDGVDDDTDLTARLALVCGTSSCHMTVDKEPVFVPGVWGPYYSAMVPGFYLNEGGQSASGKLVDHIVEKHSAYNWLREDATSRKIHVHEVLDEVLEHSRKNNDIENVAYLTKSLHVCPDFHGNRSPLADPTLKGMISGLNCDSGVESLARLYLATVQALAYGTRHILESMEQCGHKVKVLYACGGLSKNRTFLQTHADATGLPVVVPSAKEPVLLGAAMLGACAAKDVSSIQEAMARMGGEGEMISPNPDTQSYHNKKYQVFLKMYEHQRLYQHVMD